MEPSIRAVSLHRFPREAKFLQFLSEIRFRLRKNTKGYYERLAAVFIEAHKQNETNKF
jgi:hypothetical protein